jgi:3',5'-cyclic AMP phosphodiesterase CpdA
MPRPIIPLLTLAAFLLSLAWVLIPLRFELVRPRLGIPVVALPGEEFRLELRTSLPWSTSDIAVRLVGDRAHSCTVRAISSSGSRRSLSVTTPPDLAPGSYGLEVELWGVSRTSPRAVHLFAALPGDELKIVQLADLPVFGGDRSGEELMRTLVSEINLIAPDLVLVTGDINYTGSWEHWKMALEFLEEFEAPVLTCIGNHEYKGLAGFLTAFGLPRHVVDVGTRRFITLDSGHGRDQLTESQLVWMREAFESREGRSTIVQLHHPLFWKRNLEIHVDELVELCAEHEVPIVVSGHLHGDQLFDSDGEARSDRWDFPGTRYVVTTAAGADLRPPYAASPVHHGYRLIRLEGNRLVDFTYDWDGDGTRDPCCSIPVGRLRVEETGEGSVVVHNELNEPLGGAVVSIRWAGGPEMVIASRGEVIETSRVDGELRCRVRIDLPARSVTPVSLKEE